MRRHLVAVSEFKTRRVLQVAIAEQPSTLTIQLKVETERGIAIDGTATGCRHQLPAISEQPASEAGILIEIVTVLAPGCKGGRVAADGQRFIAFTAPG